jgi:glycosyltransferase involved in cell wall biosynthesis
MMLRNEADLISGTVNHALELFDKVTVVDIQSTDGTREYLEKVAERDSRLSVFNCLTQERYQSALMNRLADRALKNEADWIFFLDGDEFLNVQNRDELQNYMRDFPGDVMHMPWMNLIPSTYGKFDNFDLSQEFRWSGRVSPFRKVAVSSLFLSTHPDFYITEGNHNVLPAPGMPGAKEVLGLGLIHLPIRSAERLKYKLSNGIRLLGTKHNTFSGEGNHAQKIIDLLGSAGTSTGYLNLIASNYGTNDDDAAELDPKMLDWPTRRLPEFILRHLNYSPSSTTMAETLRRDAAIEWKKADFVKNSPVSAQIHGDEIVISAQPFLGSGQKFSDKFETFKETNPKVPHEIDIRLLTEVARASFVRIDVLRFSAWSKLIPLLYSIFSIARPRRFVELGVHNGMSFFAACQISELLQIDTECVAIDSWVGDPHASFHSTEVFDTFRETIKTRYPEQKYIQGMFLDARPCFEDKSIDLLHIDGYHTYEAVREDFETWLPKMTDNGIIIFHDINVHERGFGVWRFWEELKTKYPGFGFKHCHGLGVLYVGRETNAVSKIFDILTKNLDVQIFAQQYFEMIGELAVEHRELTEASLQHAAAHAEKDAKILEFQGYLSHRDSIIRNLEAAPSEKAKDFSAYTEQREAIIADLEAASGDNAAITAGFGTNVDGNGEGLIAHGYSPPVQESGGLIARLRHRKNRRQHIKKLRSIADTIRQSGLFDTEYYLQRNPDVREAGIDPVWHFVENGVYELRDPSAHFSVRGYLQHNRDVLQAGLNPLYHYVKHGRNEGRRW